MGRCEGKNNFYMNGNETGKKMLYLWFSNRRLFNSIDEKLMSVKKGNVDKMLVIY